ncbi:MAG: glycosyltransferase [Nitrospirae bacterium]|nr:glycosyltransferase [Nitrospirota bacterium]
MIIFWILAGITLFGIIGYLLQIAAVRSYTAPLHSGESMRFPRSFSPVSILKPLKGLDDGLFDNLESFCNLDYPAYELIFALQNRNDPAYKVVGKIKDKYPLKDITIVVEHCNEGLNPKVNNLIPAYARAKYDLILISDSNVRVEADYLGEISRHMEDPSVGLVSNLIRGMSGRSLGAVMENLHLNSFIVGSVCFLDKYLKMPCVIGKSMLMRKTELEAIGGFRSVKDFLAEDYIIGERIHRLGKRVVLSSHLINNINEYWGIKRFVNRHTRWGKLRWQIGGAKYISELAGNAVFISFMPLVLMPISWLSLLLAATVSALKIAHDYYIGKKLCADMNPLLYLLSPIKDLIIGVAWFVPILSSTVAWRGNRYIIGKDSLLSPYPEKGRAVRGPRIVTAIRTRLAWSKT